MVLSHVCRQRVGAKIQCTSCYTAYHPLCARIAGLHMEILDGEGGPDAPVSPLPPSSFMHAFVKRPEAGQLSVLLLPGWGAPLAACHCLVHRRQSRGLLAISGPIMLLVLGG